MTKPTLNLDVVSPVLRAQTVEAFEQGDAICFVMGVENHNSLGLVFDNCGALLARGIYEKCLVEAFIGTRTNHHNWHRGVLEWMFSIADRDKLRAAGDPLPGDGPFALYRGVAGRGRARRLRGMSWTSSLPCACWFATRFDFAHPAVLSLTVNASDVLCYDDNRGEAEFIVRPPALVPRLALSPEAMKAHADEARTITVTPAPTPR
jgi:hypothetical protein